MTKLKYINRRGKTSWVCPNCGTRKNDYEFCHDGIYRDGTPRYYGFCRDCKNAKAKEAYQRDVKKCKERITRYRDKNMALCRLRQRCRQANITVKEYRKIFGDHNELCDICGVPQKELTKAFCIDHDHKTGQVRGLLCNRCNTALGFLRDDVEIATRATEYLKKFNE